MTFKKIFDSVFNEERDMDNINTFRVVIGENEGQNIPHFHLLDGQNNKYVAIRLDMPSYFIHGKYKYILNSKEKKILINWLNSSNIVKTIKDTTPKNNWENLVFAWNVTNNDNINPKQPDYNNLSQDYKLDQK